MPGLGPDDFFSIEWANWHMSARYAGRGGACPERQGLHQAVVLLRSRNPAADRAYRVGGAGGGASDGRSKPAVPGLTTVTVRGAVGNAARVVHDYGSVRRRA